MFPGTQGHIVCGVFADQAAGEMRCAAGCELYIYFYCEFFDIPLILDRTNYGNDALVFLGARCLF